VNELGNLESLLSELLNGIQTVMQSGEELSDGFQLMLARELEYVTSRIEQLKASQNIQAPARPPNDAQLLWVLAGQNPSTFMEYLSTYPSPATEALLNNEGLLQHTIAQLQTLMPRGQLPVIGGIPRADLASSNIWGTKYDQRTGKMRVRFQGGSEYEYDGVPPGIYRAFSQGNASAKTNGKNRYGQWWINKSPSLGAAMNQYIKAGGYSYRKLR
jgi:hypothetical protein